MNETQRAAELQAMLQGIDLPATRGELLEYATAQEGGASFRRDLEALPDREFRSLDEVGEQLARVQPAPAPRPLAVSHEESDQPPGGHAYTDPRAEPGAVRPDWPDDNPPQKTIEQQAMSQQTQQRRQQG